MHRTAAALLALLLAVGAVAPAAATQTTQDGEGYAGAHVAFEVSDSTVNDYEVDGERMLGSVAVESQSEYRAGADVGVDVQLAAVSGLAGAETTLGAESRTSATVETSGSAELSAHDNERGVLVVDAGGEAQYVEATVGSDADAEQESESRVVVTNENGTQGTFVVVGDGSVTVNENGDVTADLGEDARLAFRSYDGERDDEDEEQERMIADGKAAAEVYVSERDGETAADVVNYGEETTLSASQSAENEVEVTVDRATDEGTVVLATVSEEVVGSLDDVEVTVDGEAAAEASSYSELEGAIGGDQSRFMVVQENDAEASADVLVAVNEFSERTVTMSGADDSESGDGDDGSDDSGTDDESGDSETPTEAPGFGVGVSVVALLAAALFARVR